MHAKNCPKCGIAWEEERSIYEYFLEKYNDETQARKTAEMYGCTPEAPRHFGKNVVGIEVQGMYDGISFWECQSCKGTFDRWTMKEVKDIKNV